jgi:two-component system nitrogen regulation response regulator GlnG
MPDWLIIDDEPTICWGLERMLKSLGHQTATASTAEEGLRKAESRRFDGVLLDVRLPAMDGITAIEHLQQRLGPVPIVVITAFGDLDTAVEALRRGAFEYLVKPFDLRVAESVINRVLPRPAVHATAPTTARPTADSLVGRSSRMQDVFKQIALAAESSAAISICGESGTGKELVARAIHRYSRRSQAPFVTVHLASLNDSLVESALFGHVRGAFTGADESRPGLLEQAHGGTVFLDEMADVPLAVQAKLLRVIEYGEVLPVGGQRPVHVDFRVISATHRQLDELVAAGSFRQDLLFRLNTFAMQLPALRERRDDIPLLVEHFVQLLSGSPGRPTIAAATLAELERRPWYGNVRELRNAVEHALMLARGGAVLPEHLPAPATRPVAESPDLAATIRGGLQTWAQQQWQAGQQPDDLYQRMLELVEPPVLEVAIDQHRGQIAAAARSLGLHRITLRKKIEQYGHPPQSNAS